MKIKTTMKNIVNRFNKVFSCGYCDLQYIMRGTEPTYYNCGVYGWNCDIYVDYSRDIAITTGYRNMRGATISHEIIERYSTKAREILELPYDRYAERVELLEQNREAFFNELSNL